MYVCYLDGELLYHPNMDAYRIENTKLQIELNKTGSFKFTIRQQNPRYGSIEKKKSIVEIRNNDRRLFRGRVLNATRGFYNQLQVTCEGELAFLLDSVVRPYEFKGSVEECFAFYINAHNGQISDSKRKFKVGHCTVTDPNDYIVRSNTGVNGYPSTLDEMKDKLIDKLGGYLWTREEPDGIYIDYLTDFETVNAQDIEFAKNLLDFEEVIKGQDIVTAIIPLGAKLKDDNGDEIDKRLTIADINDGVDYVYSPEAVERYGLIFETVTWDDVTLPENLLRKAREKLGEYINLTRSIELKAIDLHNLNRDIRSFGLGNYTRVRSAPHDLDEMLPTRKLELNLLDPLDGYLVLGDERATFVDKQVGATNKADKATQIVENVKSDYEINKTKTEQRFEKIENKLELELQSNYGLYQKVASDSITPDYTVSPLILTPDIKFKGQTLTQGAEVEWTCKADGEVSILQGVVNDDGKLIVQRNLDADTIQYICQVTYKTDDKEYTASAHLDFVRLQDGIDGADAIVLHIDSSNGGLFKNTNIATTLTISIYVRDVIIDTADKLKKHFGSGARLIWTCKQMGAEIPETIKDDDARLSDGGFILTINAKDVHTKAVFNCSLDF